MVNIDSIKRFFLYSVNCVSFAFITAAFCLSVLLSISPSSTAIAASAPTPVPTEEVTTVEAGADIAAEKIDQFSQAYLQVLQLFSDREAEIPAAETNAEALKIEKSIETDAIAIIQDSGLTLPEYMKILGLASQDETFQDKVLGRLDEAQEQP